MPASRPKRVENLSILQVEDLVFKLKYIVGGLFHEEYNCFIQLDRVESKRNTETSKPHVVLST